MFFSFLVLSFCHPYLGSEKIFEGKEQIIIFVDNNSSMDMRTTQGISGLEEARKYIRTQIKDHSARTKYKLLTHDSKLSYEYLNKEELLETLSKLKTTKSSHSFEEIQKQIRWEAGSQAHDIYWLSPFSQRLFPPPSERSTDTLHTWYLNPISFADYENIYVDTVYFSSPFLVSGMTGQLHLRLYNTGTQHRYQVPVRLLSEERQFAFWEVDVPPKGTKMLSYDLSFSKISPQGLPLRIQLNDNETLFDNEFYIHLLPSPKLNIGILGAKGILQRSLEALYADRTLFKTEIFENNSLNYDKLSQKDVVILAGLSSLPLGLETFLQGHLKKNRVLICIPGKEMNLNSFRKLFPDLRLMKETKRRQLQRISYESPFFHEVFLEKKTEIRLAEASPLYHVSGEELLSFEEQIPFLSRIRNSMGGSSYFFSSPLDPEYSNFLSDPLVVPSFFKMSWASFQTRPLYYRLPELNIKLPLPRSAGLYTVSQLGKKEKEIHIPVQHRIENEMVLFPHPSNLSTGHYAVLWKQDTLSRFAINLSHSASYLLPIHKDKLANYFPNLKNLSTSLPSRPTEKTLWEKTRKYQNLWKWTLGLALFFLSLELLSLQYLNRPLKSYP
ncbi:MAG: hypothetical protein OXB93_01350 [Cytophagales bacterium]|nr:hypothetical protein [Cytophagales bacterium]